MTTHQSQAVWELCREGYPLSADEAEIRWKSGEAYHPESEMKISRALQLLIFQSNYDARYRPVH